MPATTPVLALPYPVTDDSVDVVRDVQALAAKLDTLTGIASTPLVTSLPGSPVDGQEIYYVASAANGVIWHLRYRTANPTAYKWEYVGGPALSGYVAAGEGLGASGAWLDFTTVGPSVTVPLNGSYRVAWGGQMAEAPSAAFNWSFGVGIAGAAPVADTEISFALASQAGVTTAVTLYQIVPQTLTAGQALKVMGRAFNVGFTASKRRIELIPGAVG